MRFRRKMLGRDYTAGWSGDEQTDGVGAPRVLIEEPDGAAAFAYWHLLTDHGYDVQWCPGPDGADGRRCSLVSCGQCQLVESADLVVSALGLHEESSRDVLQALRHRHPETPVIVQGSQASIARWASVVEGNPTLPACVNGPQFLEAVEDALADRP